MNNLAKITLCALLIAALAIPAFAGGPGKKGSTFSRATHGVYSGAATVLDRSEGLFTGCLRRTFSFFNPCLDVVKGCTTRVLAPVEKPFAYVENKIWGPDRVRRAPRGAGVKKPQSGK